MMTQEQGLIEEIEPMLKQFYKFYKFKTHPSTRHDIRNPTEKWIISTCVDNVMKCTKPVLVGNGVDGQAGDFERY
jgi:hypothetical protein